MTDQKTFEPNDFPLLFEIEDRHFWFQARNKIITAFVKDLIKTFPDKYRVLEVGCGTGNVLRYLEKTCTDGMVVGMELFAEGLQYARTRVQCPLIQGDMMMPPFGVKFHLVGLFDVLEHLPEDTRVLEALHQMLEPGGVLMLTVPAHMSLWSYFDEASFHQRRYEKRDLRAKLMAAGYEIVHLTYYMTTLFPLVWSGRRAAALRERSSGKGEITSERVQKMAEDELKITPGVNGVLSAVLSVERQMILNRWPMPFGTSLLAVARRRA
jgi:SAM-dependent methyltransferase